MEKVGIGNAIVVRIARTESSNLAHGERCNIRLLSPVFTVLGASGEDALPVAVKRLLGSAMSEDVTLVVAAWLRKNRPPPPLQVWPLLVVQVLRTGDRGLASKLARQARQVCPRLSKLRSAPRLEFPCPVPVDLLMQLRAEVHAALMALRLCGGHRSLQ